MPNRPPRVRGRQCSHIVEALTQTAKNLDGRGHVLERVVEHDEIPALRQFINPLLAYGDLIGDVIVPTDIWVESHQPSRRPIGPNENTRGKSHDRDRSLAPQQDDRHCIDQRSHSGTEERSY